MCKAERASARKLLVSACSEDDDVFGSKDEVSTKHS